MLCKPRICQNSWKVVFASNNVVYQNYIRIEYSKKKSTPILKRHVFKIQTNIWSTNIILYYHMIDKLIFFTHTRLDISYAIEIMSRYMRKLHEQH